MSELVIIRPEQSAEALARKIEAAPGPARVVAGTGGKKIRLLDGRVIGPIGGEALRNALQRKIVRYPDGHETVVSAQRDLSGRSGLQQALDRGAVVIKEVEVVEDLPVQTVAGPSVATQKNAAAADLKAREEFVGNNAIR
jgi:hypothetical protein